MITVVCKICKKQFEIFPYRRGSAVCCSRKCLAFYKLKKYGHPSTWSKWKLSEDTKKRMSERMAGNTRGFQKGMSPWNKNIEWVEMSGKNHWNWKGGVKQRYEGKSTEYRKWAKSVYKRDLYSCQMCGKHCGKDIQAHHIIPWSKSEKTRFDVNNGITLCFLCHLETRGKELDFANKFLEIINLKENAVSTTAAKGLYVELRFELP